jgi:hypothetical protein
MIRYAAAQVNRVVMDLYQADLVRHLHATGISCLIPVSISHINDLNCGDASIRREGAQRLEECKQVLRELADTHIVAEWAINFLSFAASQARYRGTVRRRVAGMMSGEIKWNMQGQQQPPEQAILAWPTAQLGQRKPSQTELNMAVAPFSAQIADARLSEVNQPANVDQISLGNTTTTSSSALSPDDFSNMISFPEIWLGFIGTSESMLDMDWINNNQASMVE